jgi:hypothetical protein
MGELLADFCLGLTAISLDDEIEKRNYRAEKFGTRDTDLRQYLKHLERAMMIGKETGLRGLNVLFQTQNQST